MTVPLNGPCAAWATQDDICGCPSCGDDNIAEMTEAQIDDALMAASWVMWALSGRQFSGECEATLRPCCTTQMVGYGTWRPWSRWDGDLPWSPTLVAGDWYNVAGCGSPCVSWDCGQQIPSVFLGDRFPITEISEVRIDGDVLASSAYRLDGWRTLTRVDGERWPSTQNLLADDDQPGTWAIDVVYGQPPPVMAKAGAAELACQLLLSVCNPDACVLPARVTSVSRQGVSYNMTDIMEVVKEGRTGLFQIDLFVRAANPHGLAFAGAVRSPDLHPPRRGH